MKRNWHTIGTARCWRAVRAFVVGGVMLLLLGAAGAEEFISGAVVKVGDGDSLTLRTDDDVLDIRFYGVDCPEKAWPGKWPAQPHAAQARAFVSERVSGERVTVRLTGDTTYGRHVGEVFADGRSLSRELVRAGLAWWNKQYAEADRDLASLEAAARESETGIWDDADPTPPWVWRHMDHDGETLSGEAEGEAGAHPYPGTEGFTGDALKEQLHTRIRDHDVLTYDEVWGALKYTDEDPDNPGNVILLYTGWSIPKSEHGSGADEWNREHVWAKSRGDFGTRMGPGTDIHHLRPADMSTNSSRRNLAFDDGGQPDLDDGRRTGCYYDANSWEPRDAVKGDVARMMFYMDVRYERNLDLELVEAEETGNQPKHGTLSALLEWHDRDPVDDLERRRNERIEQIQGNRNPFIDYPAYADLIWNQD